MHFFLVPFLSFLRCLGMKDRMAADCVSAKRSCNGYLDPLLMIFPVFLSSNLYFPLHFYTFWFLFCNKERKSKLRHIQKKCVTLKVNGFPSTVFTFLYSHRYKIGAIVFLPYFTV